MPLRTALLALLALLVLASCRFTFDRELGPGELRGLVLYEAAGSGERLAAAGALVRLPGSTLAVRTDARGRFVLRDLPAGSYDMRVTFDADGRALALLLRDLTLETSLGEVGGRDVGSVVLNALGQVAGTVRRNGEPVPGATVVVNGLAAVNTDAEGRYTMKLPHGTFDLAAVYPGEEETRVQAKLALPVRGDESVDFNAADSDPSLGVVSGRVRLAQAGPSPSLDGITVALRAADGSTIAETETSADGVFTLTAPAGLYSLVASTSGYRTSVTGPVAAYPGATAPQVVLVPERGDANDCDLDSVVDHVDEDDDGDGIPDVEEADACLCDPDGAVDEGADGICDVRQAPAAPVQVEDFDLVSVLPRTQSKWVPRDTTVSVTFNAPVDPASVNGDTFTFKDENEQPVAGTIEVVGATVTFTPDAALRPSLRYDAMVFQALASVDGVALGSMHSWNFETAPAAIAGGGWHGLARLDDGTVFAWGDNFSSQLGDTTIEPSTGTTVVGVGGVGTLNQVRAVAAGNEHSLALLDDGTLVAWGSGDEGELGDGLNVGSPTPVRVLDADGKPFDRVVAIAAEYYQSAALRDDGTVWTWGENSDEQLGDGTSVARGTPTQVCDVGQTAPCSSFLQDVKQLSLGSFHTLALKNDGTVVAWGWNPYGEVGVSDSPVPVVVNDADGQPLSNIAAVDAGQYVSAALGEDGTVWTWGGNYEGQLGNGTTDAASAPVRVLGKDGVGVLSDIVAIDAAYDVVAALAADGTVWTWGANIFGALGTGTPGGQGLTPVQVVGVDGTGVLSNVKAIAATDYYTFFATLEDGSVVGWGWNDNGELAAVTAELCDTDRACSTTPLAIGTLSLF